jgi:phage tail sheath protein FI
VSDADGGITGVPGTVLERFMHVSKASDATDSEGSTIYFKDVIDAQSNYIRVSRNEPTTNWGNSTTDLSGSSYTALSPGVFTNTFTGGTDHTESESLLENGWQLMADADQKDLSLLVGSSPGTNNINRTIVEVAEGRTDCVAFISPHRADVVGLVDQEDIAQNIIDHRVDGLLSLNSSYGVMDSGWKYQFDKYNNIYRWTPLNADVAGLCARTDKVRDAWWSPAGFQRGNIKNVVKLSWNPSEVFREELYKNGINPVVTFPGQGTVLFGDKTMLTRPSAFDRINVRRLFIVLEKAISRAAQYSLFEFNDDFTRAQFKNMIEPFLRDIQGRQGIYDFRVVCDETNNTGEVIDLNQFVGDIYIKPARSINFIQLNFIVARSGVDFTEITGR